MRRWPRREFLRFLLFAGFIVILFIGQIIVSRREPRFVRIHEINPLLNFWTVRVEGRLQSDARLLKSGSLFYLVNDGTGSLAVFDQRVEGNVNLTVLAPCEMKEFPKVFITEVLAPLTGIEFLQPDVHGVCPTVKCSQSRGQVCSWRQQLRCGLRLWRVRVLASRGGVLGFSDRRRSVGTE